MRAAVITSFGGPEVLKIEDRPTPTPAASEILVRVHASALNRADLHQREGNYPAPPGAPVDVPGLEFAGEVAGVGANATRWREGDRVFGIVAGGANAEYLVTDEACVARIPDRLSWDDAAAVPEAFITAYDAMVTQAQLQADENVLVHAVGSGVGLAAIQVARAWKAVPYGTARTPSKITRAMSLGLADGAVVSSDPDSFLSAADRWTGGRGFNVIVDLVGGPYLSSNVRAAAPKGRIMLVGTVAGRGNALPLGIVLGKRLTLRGTVMRARPLEEKRAVAAAFERDIVPLLAAATLRPTVDQIFPLAQIGAAHERLAGNATFGKIVLRS